MPISSVCLKTICGNRLPNIEAPEHTFKLCSLLGVSVELNYEVCIKVLKAITTEREQDPKPYIDWLMKLKPFLSQESSNKNEHNAELVCLQNVHDSSFDSFKPNDIYLSETSQGLLRICKYQKKTIVNLTSNIDFKPLESVFLLLGSHLNAQIDHVLQAIQVISRKKTLFLNDNFQNFLTNEAYEDLRELYLILENCLVKKLQESGYLVNKKPEDYSLIEREELALNPQVKELMTEKQIQLLKIGLFIFFGI